jgi:hypothetical protein
MVVVPCLAHYEKSPIRLLTREIFEGSVSLEAETSYGAQDIFTATAAAATSAPSAGASAGPAAQELFQQLLDTTTFAAAATTSSTTNTNSVDHILLSPLFRLWNNCIMPGGG